MSYGRFTFWVLTTTIIFASFQRSEAIKWKLQPKKPTILVEGVNNTGQSLVWEFVLEGGEAVRGVKFQRKKLAADSAVVLAANIDQKAFTVFLTHLADYNASLPSTLHLKNAVTNDDEFIYSIEVSYLKNNLPTPGFKDEVHVIVQVPPKITVLPQNHSRVNIGSNVTLSCNASGDPLPDITWTKDGVRTAQYNASGHWLYLVNVQKEDFGSYKCLADNGYGIATSFAVVMSSDPGTAPSQGTTLTPQPSTHDPSATKPASASLRSTAAQLPTEQESSSATRPSVKSVKITLIKVGMTLLAVAIVRAVFP